MTCPKSEQRVRCEVSKEAQCPRAHNHIFWQDHQVTEFDYYSCLTVIWQITSRPDLVRCENEIKRIKRRNFERILKTFKLCWTILILDLQLELLSLFNVDNFLFACCCAACKYKQRMSCRILGWKRNLYTMPTGKIPTPTWTDWMYRLPDQDMDCGQRSSPGLWLHWTNHDRVRWCELYRKMFDFSWPTWD